MGYFEISNNDGSGETLLIGKEHLPELIKISVFKSDTGNMPYSIELYVPYANPVVFNNYMTQASAVKDKQSFIRSFMEWSMNRLDADGKYIFSHDDTSKCNPDALTLFHEVEQILNNPACETG